MKTFDKLALVCLLIINLLIGWVIAKKVRDNRKPETENVKGIYL